MIFEKTCSAALSMMLIVTALPGSPLAVTTTKDRSLVQDRRVEEEKRHSLLSTEVVTPVRQPPKPVPDKQKDQVFDRLELSYMMDVMQRKVTYHYDACKAIMLIKGIENDYIDLNSQLAYLRKNKILPKKYAKEFEMTAPLRKGLFAYMLAKTLGIKGVILLRVLGMRERYALKELAFEGIMAATHTKDLVSGDEFVVALKIATKYFDQKQLLIKGAK